MIVRTTATPAAGLACVVAFLVIGAGCAGSNWPRRVAVPPEKAYEVKDEATVAHVVLPDGTPFAVHDRQSDQNPGQDGTARGESNAKPDGTAFCRATASAGGSASGDFVIGHVFQNARNQPCTAVCKVQADFTQQLSLSAGADALTVADYQLEAFVRDSNERILRRYPLADSSTALGPRSSNQTAVFDLEFQMEPRTAYHVVIAGRANSKTQATTEAAAEIELTKLRMDMTVTPMSGQSTTTSPAGGE